MHHDIQLFAEYAVTPFVGVWIETRCWHIIRFAMTVTPFVGVWIETTWVTGYDQTFLSHPSWVCGLKRLCCLTLLYGVLSHPSWVCGLKLRQTPYKHLLDLSHPSWVCGLKLTSIIVCNQTASHTLRGCVD